ncbi:hypothetical protein CHU00_15775 [Sphingobacterium cellulitidis]|uniref:BREX-1 system adenine-specific DNA-methyltransferase PglX n=1 Tax=Sphingobacterium cellulitidis TaxID=1768011 RepID=UPI000B93AB61|nr:BREX-1 system adenine-specific DNA-methyltransferase PglX [Sphingobacterium cellulitidis]OYD44651.1 hypothetical protein CHU00_15775 [Sphingobacterium cellulitidis]
MIEQYYDWNNKAKQGTLDIEEVGVWQQLKNYVEVALVLSKKYAAVVANPPYMGQKSMNAQLKEYVNKHYTMTKADLFAVFMEVTLNLTHREGLMGMINQHSWMFLSSFEKYREQVLNHTIIQSMLHLGPRTFEELSGEVVQSTAFVLENSTPKEAKGSYYRLVDNKSNTEKEEQFLKKNNFYPNIPQTNFDKISGSPIAYWVSDRVLDIYKTSGLLKENFDFKQGLATGDNNRFLRIWNEVSKSNNKKWIPCTKGGGYRKWYGNNEYVVNWENDGHEIKNFKDEKGKLRSRPQNLNYYFKEGLSWSTLSSSNISFRYTPENFIFETKGSMVFPKKGNDFDSVFAYLNSSVFQYLISNTSPTLDFHEGPVSNVPFIECSNSNLRKIVKNSISISKKDWDSRETSWDFEANPLLGIREKVLGKSSLMDSYDAWKAEVSQDFFQLHANEEELNRIFIDIYGLQEELTLEVALKDITILQDELKADDLEALEGAFKEKGAVNLPIQQNIVMQQLLSYLVGTMLGRYRLDQSGLHIAHPNPTEVELASYLVENAALPFQMDIDEDAIIPLMGSACAFPDDAVKRVDELLHRMWGDESHTENLNFLNQALGMPYEKWMCEQYWAYHISGNMYKKKPIYWLFCSNPKSPQKSAFRVLLYMHRMDTYTIQKILRNYLHPHIEYVKGQYEEMHSNEANLSKQELKVYENMAKQISELKTYEQVLKDLANQQITIDLDDGVTVNFAKFEGAVAVIK